MREIVLDTETTGLDPNQGHRIIEIGCIELVNYMPSGKEFHRFINPQRDVPEDAQRVHGHFDQLSCGQANLSGGRRPVSGVHC